MLKAFTVALALFLAAACGNLPRPFEHGSTGEAYPLAELTVDVRVFPVQNLPAPMARDLTRTLTESLGGYGVTAVRHAEPPSRFVLRGKAEPPAEPGAAFLIGWTLYDAEGLEAGIHVQEVPGLPPGAPGWSAETLQTLGGVAAKAIAGLIGIDAELAETAVGDERLGLFVDAVSGAPGNGNTALTAAIGRHLRANGVEIAETAGEARYILGCEVIVAPPAEGGQHVAIRWRIRRPDGEILGEATQTNAVAPGSLDGRWGPVAGYVAGAAVPGIQDILNRQKLRETAPGFTVPAEPALPPPPAGG